MKVEFWIRILRLTSAAFAATAAIGILISAEAMRGTICNPPKFPGLIPTQLSGLVADPLPDVAWPAGIWFILAVFLALKRKRPGVSDCVSCLVLIFGWVSIKVTVDLTAMLRNVQAEPGCMGTTLSDFSGLLDIWGDPLGLQVAMSAILLLVFLMSWIGGKMVTR